MIRAWGIGFMILFIVDMMVVAATLMNFHPPALMLLLRISPFIASFVTAYLLPRKKFILGMSLAIPTAILSLVVTIVYQLLGRAVDFAGFEGGLILFAVSLAYGFILCSVGGVAGYFLAGIITTVRKNKGNKKV
ncbi:MAG: hypothetical protein ACLPN1_13315 [Dissulfurispiraceae bacterium]|jgi:hypothetical protein